MNTNFYTKNPTKLKAAAKSLIEGPNINFKLSQA